MSVLARLYGPSAWLCIGSVTIFQRQRLRETSEDNVPQACLLGEKRRRNKKPSISDQVCTQQPPMGTLLIPGGNKGIFWGHPPQVPAFCDSSSNFVMSSHSFCVHYAHDPLYPGTSKFCARC